MKQVLVLTLCSAALVSAGAWEGCPYPQEGCPKIKPQPNVDYQQYSGLWLEMYQGKEENYYCAKYDYVPDPQKPMHYTLKTEAKYENGTRFVSSHPMKMVYCSKSNSSKLHIPPPEAGEQFLPDNLDLYILETDYKNYAVEYSCSIENGVKKEIWGAQSRENVPPITEKKVKEILSRNGIDTAGVRPSRELNCN